MELTGILLDMVDNMRQFIQRNIHSLIASISASGMSACSNSTDLQDKIYNPIICGLAIYCGSQIIAFIVKKIWRAIYGGNNKWHSRNT